MTTLEQLKQIQEIEETVWNSPPIPLHQTFTAIKNGGIMLGVYKEENLIGFQYSFPGYLNGEVYLCSHMLGIHPEYRKSGLGEILKNKQKEIACEMGYSLITWTFDPLESVNAYLNLSKLRGIGDKFLENHYGTMSDALNKGLPSDRFLIKWWINSNYVKNHKKIERYMAAPKYYQTVLNDNGFPIIQSIEYLSIEESIEWLVPIPEDFQSIKKVDPELALDWRMKTREVFQSMFSSDYVAVDIFRESSSKVSYYIFQKRSTLNI